MIHMPHMMHMTHMLLMTDVVVVVVALVWRCVLVVDMARLCLYESSFKRGRWTRTVSL